MLSDEKGNEFYLTKKQISRKGIKENEKRDSDEIVFPLQIK
jgi:hypothetical protein